MKVPNGPPRIADSQPAEQASRDIGSRRTTVVRGQTQLPATPQGLGMPIAQANEVAAHQHSAPGAIEGLSMVSKHPQPINNTSGGDSGDSLEDDQSHLSTSSTKQHSFDTKSVASATTFAMDEKESIRPDDSASVRAADDEDSTSIVGRNSLLMQEPDVVMPAFRGVLSRSGGPPVQIASRRFQTLTHPPRFGDLEGPPAAETEIMDEMAGSSPTDAPIDQTTARLSSVPPSPDERLLDALASPKDRLSILQLEERILTFVTQSELQFIDLPPQNSYARLLAHKLADYYGLNHHINDDGMTIRIFRAIPFSPPTSLAVLARSIPIGSAQPAQGPTAVKIMRRSGMTSRQMSNNASTAPSSSASKATSEAGHSEEGLTSPTESTPGRDKSKMTREEREAQYKAVRERIFGDFQELAIGENASTGENSASMSRSSSSSGRKKHRRQKTPKDDSFEARSAFIPSYGPMPGMNPQGGYHQAQYIDGSMHSAYDTGQGFYGPQMNFGTTPTQAHPGFDSGMPTSPMAYGQESGDWSAMQQSAYYGYPQGSMRPSHPQMNPMQSMNQFGQYANGPQSQQSWQGSQFSPNYQQQMGPGPTGGNWMNYPGYGFGQQMQPPFAGSNPGTPPVAAMGNSSMNRSLFNPQTRSFIPSTSSSRTGSRNSSRKKPVASGGGPNQGRNTVRSPATMQPGSLPFAPRSQDMVTDPGAEATEESLQKKYGAPANLPKKPPPSQVVSHFDPTSITAAQSLNGPVNGRIGGGATSSDGGAPVSS